jgi:hypothetical protein
MTVFRAGESAGSINLELALGIVRKLIHSKITNSAFVIHGVQ